MKYYSLKEAKQLVIKAGLELVKKKLIARTWGNISARISKDEFVITPSGVPYDQVNENNLVVVKILDCSYEGNIKPSGEKKVHAAIYRLKDKVRFIIHTHQNFATAISSDGKDKDFAPVAKYGLPSTNKLVKNITKCIENHFDSTCLLMERHGAVIFGDDYDEVFSHALRLEKVSENYYHKNATAKTPKQQRKPILDDYAQMFGYSKKAVEEDEEAVRLIEYKNALAARYQRKLRPMKCLDVILQHLVYKNKYSKLKDKNK